VHPLELPVTVVEIAIEVVATTVTVPPAECTCSADVRPRRAGRPAISACAMAAFVASTTPAQVPSPHDDVAGR
jgi:hypothetical protein